MKQGQVPGAAAVVKDQVTFPLRAFPAKSFTPLLPPAITVVYVVEVASADAGANVAVELPLL
jgi:hypothetical protein